MLTPEEIEQIRQLIERNQRFVITTHLNPDGDGLGSEIALAAYLKARKKTVRVLNTHPLPKMYAYLDDSGLIEQYNEQEHVEYVTSADAIFILDISDWERLVDLGSLVRKLPLEKVCIDHHPGKAPFTDFDVIHPEASSTGELIYALLKGVGASFNRRIRDGIYTAILTDTGGFKYKNTTPSAHRAVADLLEQGLDSASLYQQIYENQSLARVRLLARALQGLQFAYDGQLAWVTVTRQMMADCGAGLADLEGLSDFPRTIEGVEVALLFTELDPRRVKVSFRSKGRIVINTLARSFEGGGHAFAAGAVLAGALPPAVEKVVAQAAELFKSP